jgi:DNA transformation protein and related proteins
MLYTSCATIGNPSTPHRTIAHMTRALTQPGPGPCTAQDTIAATAALPERGLPTTGRRPRARSPGLAASRLQGLAALPGLGPRSREMLAAAGIGTHADLQALGSVNAWLAVKQHCPTASLNLLWALEGVLTHTPWQQVAREQRTRLLTAIDAATEHAQALAAQSGQ